MRVSLDYISEQHVSLEARKKILAESKTLAESHDWWCESINFFDGEGIGDRLMGSTKIFLPGYSTEGGGLREFDPEKDVFMAKRDARLIIDSLSKWSKEFGISWALEAGGGDAGTIKDGEPDENAEGFLASMEEMVKVFSAMAGEADLAAMILDEYSDR